MKTIKLEIEFTYDPDSMHGNDADSIRWFYRDVLGGELILHSNEIGDEVGTVKVDEKYLINE
jgi:hypothetical protein